VQSIRQSINRFLEINAFWKRRRGYGDDDDNDVEQAGKK